MLLSGGRWRAQLWGKMPAAVHDQAGKLAQGRAGFSEENQTLTGDIQLEVPAPYSGWRGDCHGNDGVAAGADLVCEFGDPSLPVPYPSTALPPPARVKPQAAAVSGEPALVAAIGHGNLQANALPR